MELKPTVSEQVSPKVVLKPYGSIDLIVAVYIWRQVDSAGVIKLLRFQHIRQPAGVAMQNLDILDRTVWSIMKPMWLNANNYTVTSKMTSTKKQCGMIRGHTNKMQWTILTKLLRLTSRKGFKRKG